MVKCEIKYNGRVIIGGLITIAVIVMLSFAVYYIVTTIKYKEKYKSIKDYKYECSFENAIYYEKDRDAIGYGSFKLTPFDKLQLTEIINFGRDGVFLGNNKTSEELFWNGKSRNLEAENMFVNDFKFTFYQNNQDIYYTECLYDYEYGYYHICHFGEAEFLNEEEIIDKYGGEAKYYCLTNVYRNYANTLIILFVLLFLCTPIGVLILASGIQIIN